MTSPRFLDYEVVLLLAKYGKDTVLNAVARRLTLTQEELESLLNGIDRSKAPRRSAKNRVVDAIEPIVAQFPQKSEQLRALQGHFRNRTFLPELRDVRRFFEQHSRNLGNAKSRAESLPKLMMLLAALDVAELNDLCRARTCSEYSSLGIISDEILGRNK